MPGTFGFQFQEWRITSMGFAEMKDSETKLEGGEANYFSWTMEIELRWQLFRLTCLMNYLGTGVQFTRSISASCSRWNHRRITIPTSITGYYRAVVHEMHIPEFHLGNGQKWYSRTRSRTKWWSLYSSIPAQRSQYRCGQSSCAHWPPIRNPYLIDRRLWSRSSCGRLSAVDLRQPIWVWEAHLPRLWTFCRGTAAAQCSHDVSRKSTIKSTT